MPQARNESPSGGEPPAVGVPLLVVIAGLALLAVLILASAKLHRLSAYELTAADVRTALLSERAEPQHRKIVVVDIGPGAAAPVQPRLGRDRLAALVEAIDAAGPQAIGLDVTMLRPTVPEHDRALHVALRDAKAPIVVAAADERERTTPDERGYQVAYLAAAGRAAGYKSLQRERDGVVRYHAGPANASRYPSSFSLLLARAANAGAQQTLGRIAWLQPSTGLPPLSWLFEQESRPAFTGIAADDLLDRDPQARHTLLEGRIVLIGDDTGPGVRHRTPLTALGGDTTREVMIHAHAVAQLIDGRSIAELPPDMARLLLLTLGSMGGVLGWWLHASRRLWLGCVLATAALIGIDAVVFSQARLILPVLTCLLAWFAGMLAGHHIGLVHDRILQRAQTRG